MKSRVDELRISQANVIQKKTAQLLDRSTVSTNQYSSAVHKQLQTYQL